jgi:hypothetical protein
MRMVAERELTLIPGWAWGLQSIWLVLRGLGGRAAVLAFGVFEIWCANTVVRSMKSHVQALGKMMDGAVATFSWSGYEWVMIHTYHFQISARTYPRK